MHAAHAFWLHKRRNDLARFQNFLRDVATASNAVKLATK